MERILTEKATSISELKANPMLVMQDAKGEPLAILNRNKPAFYCITPDLYEAFLDMMDDIALKDLVQKRKGEKEIKVKTGDL
jgi:antitoxin StbD